MLPSYLGGLARELMSFKIHFFFVFSFKALRSYHLPSYSINTRSHLPGFSSPGCSSNPHVSSCCSSVASSVQSTVQQIWHWPQHPVSGYIHFPLFLFFEGFLLSFTRTMLISKRLFKIMKTPECFPSVTLTLPLEQLKGAAGLEESWVWLREKKSWQVKHGKVSHILIILDNSAYLVGISTVWVVKRSSNL